MVSLDQPELELITNVVVEMDFDPQMESTTRLSHSFPVYVLDKAVFAEQDCLSEGSGRIE